MKGCGSTLVGAGGGKGESACYVMGGFPSRNTENFSNLASSSSRTTPAGGGGGSSTMTTTVSEDASSLTWGTASQQTNFDTYIATHDRASLPKDQVIGTEKVNVLLKHFYDIGERQKHGGGGESPEKNASSRAKGKGKAKKRIGSEMASTREMKKRK
ncbi:hypothetical protein HOP50_19g83770 [Chloropicon primus]|uniref:DET1- and DDB1-associated protein 1 domain-containing protein n=1 Tax=Chloropicon primus TaxID=1764295 RepID=A0A5B8N1S3_9CHLO|nr:hypothetical protein A3770_19p83530 [Chloropicon primus]UPR05030.1 hypothetical protein HOP50_19g83770 [Chloropicon primus]|mmetsp:Transcript_3592/g.10143  ORF Transcript_3592/g.10143 Transcript_3592/m.10143 type:complete len:157 (-) Transcript_3592:118-588(-)|eukprot:QDZ25835.1 hypothetical protein A3770_19p83530 [Chloropicon primus]